MANTGIYQIKNTVNGRFYIGASTNNFRQRWSEHKSVLRKGNHRSQLLQDDWNQYGESAFVFEILEHISPEKVYLREAELLSKFHDNGVKCYNKSKLGVPGSGKWTPEIESAVDLTKVNATIDARKKIKEIAKKQNRFVYEVVDEMIEIYKKEKGI